MKGLDVFETEYKDSIKEAYDTIDTCDKILMGKIIAIVHRSDSLLERPKRYSYKKFEDQVYVIYKPSKISTITQNKLKVINSNNIKFLSLPDFVNCLTEFHFSYMQIALNDNAIIGCDDQFWLLTTLYKESVNFQVNKKTAFRKMVSTSIGILGDIKQRKFKEKKVIDDRLFLLWELLCICDNYIKNDEIKLIKMNDDVTYNSWYNLYIKDTVDERLCYSSDGINWLDKKVGNIINKEKDLAPKESTTYYKISSLMHACNLLSCFDN